MKGFDNHSKENYNLIPKHTLKLGINKNLGHFYVSNSSYFVSSVKGNPRLNIPISGQFMADFNFGSRCTTLDF